MPSVWCKEIARSRFRVRFFFFFFFKFFSYFVSFIFFLFLIPDTHTNTHPSPFRLHWWAMLMRYATDNAHHIMCQCLIAGTIRSSVLQDEFFASTLILCAIFRGKSHKLPFLIGVKEKHWTGFEPWKRHPLTDIDIYFDRAIFYLSNLQLNIQFVFLFYFFLFLLLLFQQKKKNWCCYKLFFFFFFFLVSWFSNWIATKILFVWVKGYRQNYFRLENAM